VAVVPAWALLSMAKERSCLLDSGNRAAGPILVLDQSPEILSLIEIVLREDGFAVEAAISNEEALRKAAVAEPALVLMDVGLSPSTEEVFVAALREMYRFRVPLIVVSALCEPAFQKAIIMTGAIAAIRKPFDLSDLLVAVQRAVNESRGTGSLTPACAAH
jgi:DNA-binding response OmpR family regulator